MDATLLAQHEDSRYSLLTPAADRRQRVLGIPFAADLPTCQEAAFSSHPGSMSAAGAAWRHLQPNLFGRALIATQCLASKAIYQANVHTPPPRLLQTMQTVVNSFVASSLRPEEATPLPSRLYPAAHPSYLPRAAGGLGLPNLDTHFRALRAKPVWLIFQR